MTRAEILSLRRGSVVSGFADFPRNAYVLAAREPAHGRRGPTIARLLECRIGPTASTVTSLVVEGGPERLVGSVPPIHQTRGRTMDRIPIESHTLAGAGYDPQTRVLEIEFRNGGVYRYYEVGDDVLPALLAAESRGKWFAAHIRGQYRTTKLDATGREVDPSQCMASARSLDMLRSLARKAGLWSGGSGERLGAGWRNVVAKSGAHPGTADALVETWLASLRQPQCSAAIEYLKSIT